MTKILGVLVGIGVLVIGVVLVSNWTRIPEEVNPQESEIEKSEIEAPKKESPTNTYIGYYDALREGNMEKIKKYLAKNMIEQLEQSGMKDKETLEIMRWFMPEEIEITDETIKGDYAFLTVRGIKDLRYVEGKIEMIKENDKWKLLKESWSQVALSHWQKEKMDIAAVDIIFIQKEKGNADLKAIIENNGKMVVPQLSYSFSINGSKESGSFPVTINPGKKFELDLSHAYSNYYAHYPKKGSKIEMVLILDPEDELKEFNEENNKITKIFYLQD